MKYNEKMRDEIISDMCDRQAANKTQLDWRRCKQFHRGSTFADFIIAHNFFIALHDKTFYVAKKDIVVALEAATRAADNMHDDDKGLYARGRSEIAHAIRRAHLLEGGVSSGDAQRMSTYKTIEAACEKHGISAEEALNNLNKIREITGKPWLEAYHIKNAMNGILHRTLLLTENHLDAIEETTASEIDAPDSGMGALDEWKNLSFGDRCWVSLLLTVRSHELINYLRLRARCPKIGHKRRGKNT